MKNNLEYDKIIEHLNNGCEIFTRRGASPSNTLYFQLFNNNDCLGFIHSKTIEKLKKNKVIDNNYSIHQTNPKRTTSKQTEIMTKQDAINQNWWMFLRLSRFSDEEVADEWIKIEKFIDSDGFFNPAHARSKEVILKGDLSLLEEKTRLKVIRYRPKSLSGIETNNSWIKILSEADLPKECASYWVIDKFMESNPCQSHYTIQGIHGHDMHKRDWLERFTHYQPIIKPLKPIY